jgi:hypothetical protein
MPCNLSARKTWSLKSSFRFVVLMSSTFSQQVSRFFFSLDRTETHITVGRTPLDEGSAPHRELCLTTQTFTRDKHPCPRQDSNPRSQQALGRRPTPYSAWPLGSVPEILPGVNDWLIFTVFGRPLIIFEYTSTEMYANVTSLFKYLDDGKIYGKYILGLKYRLSNPDMAPPFFFAAVCRCILRVSGKSKYISPSVIRTMWGGRWPGLPGNQDHRGETPWYR